MGRSTSPWPRAATCSSTTSAATACSSSASPSEEERLNGQPQARPLLVLMLLAPSALAQDPTRAEQMAQACAPCHGPNGNSSDPRYPILAGQTMRYAYLQLKDYKEGR